MLIVLSPAKTLDYETPANTAMHSLPDLRDDAERVMKKNFPNSVFFKGGVVKNKPWWKVW